jgi:hypothetical protein
MAILWLALIPKKKEMLWEFARDGKHYATERIKSHDHDFKTQSTGTVIPLWIYNIQKNTARILLNTSHDTSELNCKAIENWRVSEWKEQYSQATEIVILNDSWWSNAANSLLYKHELQLLSNRINQSIRVAHYPPYTSKYNPIEHKLFCHVHRSCEWTMFTSVEVVQQLMAKTTTKQWLVVNVDVDNNIYKSWRRIPKNLEKIVRKIPHRDKVLPQRNYVIHPDNDYEVIF